MFQPTLARVVHTLQTSTRRKSDVPDSDQELLGRFVQNRDEVAFRALVQRHGQTVLSACRQVLTDPADAEDAFQAAFLVLLKKAKRLAANPAPLGGWLYAVAHRLAVRCRADRHRRSAREAEAARRAERTTEPADLSWREATDALHEELNALPDKYRLPLLLCGVQGLTRDEAAEQLDTSVGAVRGRLERGRALLERRLTKRGLLLSAGWLALVLGNSRAAGGPSAALIDLATGLTAGKFPHAVAALATGVFPMIPALKPLAAIGAVVAMAVAFGLSVGLVSPQPAAHADEKPAVKAEKLGDRKPTKDAESTEMVTVRVVDPDGKPVAGATVYQRGWTFLDTQPGKESTLGKTDTSGSISVEWKPFTFFHATADGFCATASEFLNGPAAITIRLAKPLPIKGRLVDLQGKAVPNAKVIVESVSAAAGDDLTAAYNAYRVNPENAGGAFETRLDGQATGAPKGTTTDKDGRFALTGVGRLRAVHLRFEAEGIESARVTVMADPEFAIRMKPPTDSEKKLTGMSGDYRATTHGPEFTHAARPDHVITGTVTDAISGKPVKGVKVAGTTSNVGQMFFGNPWHDTVAATTDADGKFRLAGLVKAKRRFLHVQGTDAAPYLDHIAELPDSEGYTPAVADVKLRPAVVVRGQLLNKVTGNPVAGEAHWLPLTTNEPLLKGDDDDTKLYTSQLGNTWPSGGRGVAGADGRFTLRVPTGPGVVLARCDQFDPSAIFTTARVREDDRKHLRKSEKDPNVTETGTKDRDGEEFFDTIMLISPLRWENGYALISPDAKAKSVDVKIGFDPGATVTLAPTDPDGKPLGGVTVVGPGRYGLHPPTFAKPEVAVGGIDPKGRPVQFYLLHKERKLCAAITLKGNETGPVAVKMHACGNVSGKVVDHTGKPVKGASVMFQMTDSVADDLLRQKLYRGSTEVATDAEGQFTFPRMFPNVEFGLHVSLPGFRSGAAESKLVTLKPGEVKNAGEFKLRDPKKTDDE